MTDLETGGKLLIFSSVLLGTSQVVCGYLLLLLAVSSPWGYYPFPANSAMVTTSLIAITSGKSAVAFACLRGKVLRLAVLIISVLCCIFAVCSFPLLVTSAKKHAHCEGAIESVTLLGTIINASFLFFLFKGSQSRPELEVSEEDINDAPPPYEVAVRNSNA